MIKIKRGTERELLVAIEYSLENVQTFLRNLLLEAGTDLRYIQEILGHKSSKTTEIYTHVTQKDILRIRSPLDL